MLEPAVRPGDAADGRDAERDAQLDRPAGPRHRRLPRARPAWLREHGARAVVSDRRQQRRGVRRAGRPAARRTRPRRRSRSTSPAPTSRTAAWSSPATRSRRPRCRTRYAAHTAPGVPVFAKLSPDVTDIVAIAAVLRRRRAPTGCRMINTLLGMVIDPDDHAPGAGRRHRRTVRAGDQARSRSGASGRCTPPCPRCRSSAWAASTGLDALELILAGASAVSVGTAIFHDPSAPGAGPARAGRRARGPRVRLAPRRRRPRPPTG